MKQKRLLPVSQPVTSPSAAEPPVAQETVDRNTAVLGEAMIQVGSL
jgi:hypothetical protein